MEKVSLIFARLKPEEPHMRLVDGSNENSGRVEILYDDQWGTVCDDYFGQEEALVVCRALGYNFGAAKGWATYGQGTYWNGITFICCVLYADYTRSQHRS